ncbi:MAG: PAS domain S-box protein [Proteobacteria bacterium]|nr:PAS domain S-box protein [Pseudomonadota bacterium]
MTIKKTSKKLELEVAERKLAEKALLENQGLLEKAQRIANIGSWAWDLKTNAVTWDDNLYLMHGMESQEFDGQFDTVMSLIHPDDLGLVQEKIGQLLDCKQPFEFDYRIITRDGVVKFVRGNQRIFLDDEGNVARMHGALQDITEHRKAEQSLRESEQKYRTLFETMTQGVVYQNKDGEITSANPASQRILGLSLDQMQGRTSLDPRWKAIHEDGSDFSGETHPSMVALKTGEEVRNALMGVFHPDKNRYVWININAIPQFAPENKTPYQVYATFEDVTDRKWAEEALIENTFYLKKAQEISKIGHFSYDPKSSVVQGSDELFRIFDVARDQPLFETFADAVHPEDGHLIFPFIDRAVEEGIPYDVEYRVMHRNGAILHVHAKGGMLNTPEATRMVGTVQDITERKLAQDKLAQSERYYRSLLHSLHEDIIIIDRDYIVTDVNNKTLKILGAKREDVIGRYCYDVLHKADRKCHELGRNCGLRKVIDTGKHVNMRREHRTFDGKAMQVDIQMSPIRDHDGNIIKVIQAMRDVTDLYETQEKLNHERRRLSDIISGTNVGTWEWNFQTKEAVINERWADILGYTLEELSPISADAWERFTHPNDLKKSKELLKKHIDGELDFYECEMRALNKNGDWVWVLDTGKVATWTNNDKPVLLSGTRQDISERKQMEHKRAEEAKRESEQLAATRRMAAAIAHEINNPLAGIKNSFRLIKKSMPTDMKHYSFVPIIEKEIDRMSRIVRHMFDLYKPGHEKPQEFDLNIILDDLVDMLEINARQSDVVLSSPLLIAGSVIVFLHKDLFVQVMFNVIKNAIEASPKGGRVETEIAVDKHQFQIRVKDQGQGIGKEIRDRVFEPFFSTKDEPSREGRGLGLSVSKSMVESMGGTITFYSRPENGTVFKINLPLKVQDRDA